MRKTRAFGTYLLAIALGGLAAPPPGAAGTAGDLAAVRALFERNLDAIRNRDKDAYLSCYLQSEQLVRTGAGGISLGYADVVATAGQAWPEHFDAQDLRLVPVAPGVVYGTYRYRVRYGEAEAAGLSERLFLSTADGWKIAVSTAFEAPAGTSPPARALVGATLLTGTGAPPIADAVVLVADGKIVCAGARSACPVPPETAIFDARGLWLTPGLIDAHVHFSQTGWADGRPDALDVRAEHPYAKAMADLAAHPDRLGRTMLCSGITAAFDVGGYPWTLALRERFETDTRVPRVAATGPLLTTMDHWLNLPGEKQFAYLADAAAARAAVQYLKTAGSTTAKVWLIVTPEGRPLPELEALVATAAAEARAQGMRLAVHATGLADAKAALRAGANVLVHSVWDETIDDEFVDLLRSSGAIYVPTLTVSGGYQRLFEAAAERRAPEVDDPNRCLAPETLARLAATATVPPDRLEGMNVAAFKARENRRAGRAAANLQRIAAAGLPIALGTDAGNPLTLHGPSIYAEAEAMQAAGMSPAAVLQAATLGGARALGREAELGTIEAGKAADLLLLGADPAADIKALRQLRYVMRGGEMRSLDELRAAR